VPLRDRRLHSLASCAALGALFALGAAGGPVTARPAAQTSGGSAGLVVDYGNGTVGTFCLSVPAGGVTGLELLQRTGLAVRFDVVGLGAEICAINGVGCLDPGAPCYCQCQGTPCVFWQFAEWRGGRWAPSTVGASGVTVRPGAIEGWGWGKNPPPPSGNALCALAPAATPTPRPARPTATRPAATATPRVPPTRTRTPRPVAPPAPPARTPTAPEATAPGPSATHTAPPTATATAPTETAPPSPTATPGATATPRPIPPSPTAAAPPPPAATPTAEATPAPGAQAGTVGPPASYWLFGALAVGLLGLIAWARAARARVP
jgi:hypothetical protein